VSNGKASSNGGGLYLNQGTITISDVVISSNKANGGGGGIYATSNTNLTLLNSVVTNNEATGTNFDGGGLYLSSPTFTIDGCTFSNNKAGTGSAATGGGIVVYNNGFAVVTGTIRNSTISGNSAGGVGGGLYLAISQVGDSITIQNCTISGNTSGGNGGGIQLYSNAQPATVNILNSTIVNNTAGGIGGGINVGTGGAASRIVTIANSVIAGNTDTSGANDIVRSTGSTLNASFSLFQTAPAAGTINGTSSNVTTGVDPLLGPLADNGGPTFTHLPLAGSPLINAGDPNFAPPPNTDQRGDPRVAQGRLDIGAVEVQAAGLPTVVTAGPGAGGGSKVAVLNPDGTTKTSFDTFTGTTGGVRTATADVNNDGVADYIVGTGPGTTARFRVYNGVTLALIAEVVPFGDFTGGVYVAAGDFNNDGFAEVVVTPDEGGGPVVAVYRGVDLAGGKAVELVRYFGIQDDAFRGGARAAVGDVNGDNVPDVVVAAGFSGGPRIQVWDGVTIAAGVQPTTALANFFAFEETLRNGVFVAVGDVTGDGVGDFIFGGGPGGGPRVRIADGAALLAAGNFGTLDAPAVAGLTVGNFFAGNPDSRGGVRVATADLDGDTIADIATGAGDLQPATVTTYVGKTALGTTTPPVLFGVNAFPGVDNGVFVG
jgi:predicted outer membrane repeat protein